MLSFIPDNYILESILKIVQILFFIGTFGLAVLTYISAKNGLLNTVNTEYRKLVIRRLKLLSEELASEFDPNSDNFWLKDNKDEDAIIKRINDTFLKNKAKILETKKFSSGIPIPEKYGKICASIDSIKMDAFIPEIIRKQVIDFLQKRSNAISDAYCEVIEKYKKSLASGKYINTLDENKHWLHNQINDFLYKNGCGVSQVQEDVLKVRRIIQEYFESFDPIKK